MNVVFNDKDTIASSVTNMCFYIFSSSESQTSAPRRQTSHRLSSVLYYFSGVSREKAQRMLESHPVGTYLLRDCESVDGNFTLSFKYDLYVNKMGLISYDISVKIPKM